VEIQALMKYYDVNGDGHLSYEEFIKVLREPLNSRRAAIVDKAWAHLSGGTDRVALQTVLSQLSFAGDKEFQRGTKSAEQILSEFARNFNSDIRQQEFIDYYSDLSMTVTHDEQFVQIVE
jgi:Ca2+-binding EF-hand superfamily protein